MNISWKITKKRGNWRPSFKITLTLEDWELDLGLPDKIEVKTKIPRPYACHEAKCPPGLWERANPPEGTENTWQVKISLQAGNGTFTERLPWRPGAQPEYPEVEEAAHQLREEIERLIREAYDSEGWEAGGELGLTEETKRYVAPGVAARRMLKVVGGQDQEAPE